MKNNERNIFYELIIDGYIIDFINFQTLLFNNIINLKSIVFVYIYINQVFFIL